MERGAQVDRRRLGAALVAPQPGQQRREGRIPALAQQPDRQHYAAVAAGQAAQLEVAVRPVGQAMVRTERDGMHPDSLALEHLANKLIRSDLGRAKPVEGA